VLKAYRESAVRRKLEWTLTTEEFLYIIHLNCTYCGDPPSNYIRKYNMSFAYSGIDRVDNSKGYVEGNVVPCCAVCNAMKEKLSVDGFLKHVFKIADKRRG